MSTFGRYSQTVPIYKMKNPVRPLSYSYCMTLFYIDLEHFRSGGIFQSFNSFKGEAKAEGYLIQASARHKRVGFRKLRYIKRKGNLLLSYSKGPLIKIFPTNAPYDSIISFIRHHMKMIRRIPFSTIYS